MSDVPDHQTPLDVDVTRPDHHGSGVEHPVEVKKRKRRLLRLFVRLAVVLVLLVVLLVVLAPTLVSTGPGTRWLVGFVNSQVQGELSIEELSVSWLGGQRIEGVVYDDPGQGIYFEANQVNARDLSLLELLRGRRNFGEIWLSGAEVVYDETSGQTPNVEQPDDPTEENTPLQLPASLSGTLVVEDTTVTYQAEGVDPLVLSFDHEVVVVPDIRDISVNLSVDLAQGEHTGLVELSGNVLNLFDPDGVHQVGQAAYKLEFAVDTVPVEALDLLLSGFDESRKPGEVTAMLGQGNLFLRVTVDGTIDQLESTLAVSTSKLDVEFAQRTKNGVLITSPDSSARWDIDQATFDALLPDAGWKLVEPTRLELASVEMSLPVDDEAVDWGQAGVSLLLKAGANLAIVDEQGQVVGIDALRVQVQSDSINKVVSYDISTVLSAVDEGGQVVREPVRVEGQLREPISGSPRVVVESEALPVNLLDTLLGIDGGLSAVLGPEGQRVEAALLLAEGHLSEGQLALNWDSENDAPLAGAWASLKPVRFGIDDEQVLTLLDGGGVELRARVTEAFGDRWMGKLHPILFDAQSGDRPVRVVVDGESFRFPLQGEGMAGSRVEAQIDLGTVAFGEGALLGQLLQWTDRPGERALFDPMEVSLTDGRISYDQFNLTVGKVKLRMDGEIDLNSEQIVAMAVRVPGDSLLGVFHDLEGVIGPEDELSLPMTGSIRQPVFDRGLIVREVARMTARGLIEREKDKLEEEIGEELGGVLGDLLRRGLGGSDEPEARPEEEQESQEPEAEPMQEPASEPEPEKSVEEELIDRGVDLIFRRLRGKDE